MKFNGVLSALVFLFVGVQSSSAFAMCKGTYNTSASCSASSESECRSQSFSCNWNSTSEYCWGSYTESQSCTLLNESQCHSQSECSWEVPYDKIEIKNSCPQAGKLWTALVYKNLDNEWVTEGFWTLEPNQTAYVADTRNSVYYYHAHNADRSSSWTGDHVETLYGKEYKFRRGTTGENWGTHTINLTCND